MRLPLRGHIPSDGTHPHVSRPGPDSPARRRQSSHGDPRSGLGRSDHRHGRGRTRVRRVVRLAVPAQLGHHAVQQDHSRRAPRRGRHGARHERTGTPRHGDLHQHRDGLPGGPRPHRREPHGPDRRSASVGVSGEQGLALRHSDHGPGRDNRQTVAISFNRAVTGLSFTITDLDSSSPLIGWLLGLRRARAEPHLRRRAPQRHRHRHRPDDAWRYNNANTAVDDTSGAGNVTVTYTAPVSAINLFFYSQTAAWRAPRLPRRLHLHRRSAPNPPARPGSARRSGPARP